MKKTMIDVPLIKPLCIIAFVLLLAVSTVGTRKTIRAHVRKALQHESSDVDAKKTKQKIQELSRAIMETPDSAIAYVTRGDLYVRDETTYREAEQDFCKALEIDERNPEARLALAFHLHRVRKFGRAVDELTLALKQDIHLAIKKYILRMDKYLVERQILTKEQVQIYWDSYGSEELLGPKYDRHIFVCRFSAHDVGAEIDLFEKTVLLALTKNKSGLIEVYSYRCDDWDKLGVHDRTIADINRMLEIAPKKRADLIESRFFAYLAANDHEKALSDSDTLLAIDSESPTYLSQRALYYWEIGDKENRLRALEKALRNAISRAEGKYSEQACNLLLDIARCHFDNGRYEQCVELSTKCIEQKNHATQYWALWLRAASHAAMGDDEKALGDLTVASMLSNLDSQINAHISLGAYFVDRGEWNRASEEFAWAIKKKKKQPQIYFERARMHDLQGDKRLAAEDLKRAFKYDEFGLFKNRAFAEKWWQQ